MFLSYSGPDQAQVERVAQHLAKDYPVWFDQAMLVPGDSWSDRLDEALRYSSHCLEFVGAELSGPWQDEEVRSFINRAVTEVGDFWLIQVLLPGAPGRPGESELPSDEPQQEQHRQPV